MTTTQTWAERTLALYDCFDHPDQWLTVPPDDAGLADLMACRGLIEEPRNPYEVLRQLQLQQLLDVPATGPEVQITLGGTKVPVSRTSAAGDPQRKAAEWWAAKCGGEAKREGATTITRLFLLAVEDAIAARLEAGERHPGILATEDFPEITCVSAPYSGTNTPPLAIAFIDRLPDGHPGRGVALEPFRHDAGYGRRAAVALGLAPGQKARHFYAIPSAGKWTADLIQYEFEQLAQKSIRSLTEEELRRLRERETTAGLSREELNRLRAQSQATRPIVRPQPPDDWRRRTEFAIRTLPKSDVEVFDRPGPDVPLADLWAVREAFVQGVEDVVTTPAQAAAERFAARVAGQVRRDDLTDRVLELLRKCDRLTGAAMHRATVWAATEGMKLATEVAELRERVAVLEGRKGKR